jgi:hypothetical protein
MTKCRMIERRMAVEGPSNLSRCKLAPQDLDTKWMGAPFPSRPHKIVINGTLQITTLILLDIIPRSFEGSLPRIALLSTKLIMSQPEIDR